MKVFYFLIGLFLLSTSAIYSQTVLRGTVLDKNTKEPIINAKIGISGQSIGVASNNNGWFTYRKYQEVLTDESVMRVSASNYKPIEVTVDGIRALNAKPAVIYLEPLLENTSNVKEKKDIVLFWDASLANKGIHLTQQKAYILEDIAKREFQTITFVAFNERIQISEKIAKASAQRMLPELIASVTYDGNLDLGLLDTRSYDEVLFFSNTEPLFYDIQVSQEIPVHVFTNNDIEIHPFFEKLVAYTSGEIIAITPKRQQTDTPVKQSSQVSNKRNKVRVKNSISGQIVSNDLSPINFAIITKEGSLKEYYTEEDGSFYLPAQEGDKISFFCLGHFPKTIEIDASKNYNIVLIPKAEILEEVVLEGKMSKAPRYDFDKEKQTDKIGNRRVPVRTIYKEDFKSSAFDVLDLVDGWFGITTRTDRFGGRYATLKGGCVKFLIDGVESLPQQVNIAAIERITVYDGFGSVLPCPASIIITTLSHPDIIDQKFRRMGIDPLRNNTYNEYVGALDFNILDDMYLKEIAQLKLEDKKTKYGEMQKRNVLNVDFYVEMAQYFKDLDVDFAQKIRSDFAAIAKNNLKALRVLAYLHEAANANRDAQKVFKRIVALDPSNPASYRDLALIYQETKEYNAAFELYVNMLGNQILGVDFSTIQKPLSNELQRLVKLHKHKIAYQRLPNDWLETNFNIDVRMTLSVSELNTPFEFQFVDPNNKFYNWKSNSKFDKKVPTHEFIIDKALSGKWKVNIRYTGPEQQKHIAPYLKYTIYKNFGTKNEEKAIKLIRIDAQLEKVMLDSFVYQS